MGEMKTTEEVLKALRECTNQNCTSCPYFGTTDIGELTTCTDNMRNDAVRLILRLADENRAMKAELKVNLGNQYWMNICKMNARQEAKGLDKYGGPLEKNTTLTTVQRIEHLQEELIDGLKYCEHLKTVCNDGITANNYQRACLRTAPGDKTEWLENAIYGIIGEAGEIVDLVKKYKWQGHTLNAEDVALELGDLLWYGSLLASAINYDLGTVMQMNEKKLEQRYPEGFSKDRSINREQ